MVHGLAQALQSIQNLPADRCPPRPERRKRLPDPFPPFFPGYTDDEFLEQQSYSYEVNGTLYKGKMGDKMKVRLLPGAFMEIGSAPGVDELEPITSFLREKAEYKKYSFIKGHMWNQQLGGKGVTKNLVPLTTQANSAHKSQAEEPIKAALLQFGNFYMGNNSGHDDYDKVYALEYVVQIEDQYWPPVTELIVPNAIHIQVFPLKYYYDDKKKLISLPDESIVDTAITDLGVRDKINRMVSGIWIAQDGQVTDAVNRNSGNTVF